MHVVHPQFGLYAACKNHSGSKQAASCWHLMCPMLQSHQGEGVKRKTGCIFTRLTSSSVHLGREVRLQDCLHFEKSGLSAETFCNSGCCYCCRCFCLIHVDLSKWQVSCWTNNRRKRKCSAADWSMPSGLGHVAMATASYLQCQCQIRHIERRLTYKPMSFFPP